MKEKDKKEEWYLPWVVRPEALRASQVRQRLQQNSHHARDHPGSPSGSKNPGHSLPYILPSSSQFDVTQASRIGRPKGRASTHIEGRKKTNRNRSSHEGLHLYGCQSKSDDALEASGTAAGTPGCPHGSLEVLRASSSWASSLTSFRSSLHSTSSRAASFDGSQEDYEAKQPLLVDSPKNSPKPTSSKSREKPPLRQAESLDNVFETNQALRPSEAESDALAVNTQASVSSAVSLPQINQISDYEDDLDPGGRHFAASRVQSNESSTSTVSQNSAEFHSRHKSNHLRSKKKTKSTLKRKQAIREKDGRSKSLTQIDNLADSRGMLLPRSKGEDDGKGNMSWSVEDSPAKMHNESQHAGKLNIPGEHTARRPPLSMENRVSSSDFADHFDDSFLTNRNPALKDLQDTRDADSSCTNESPDSRIGTNFYDPCSHPRNSQFRGRDETKSPIRPRTTQNRKSAGNRYSSGASTELEYSPLTCDDRPNGGHDSSKSIRSSKPSNRWSIFQPSKDPKMDDLIRQLDLYSRIGIPRQPHLLACQSISDEYDLSLEDSWRNVINCFDSQMSDREEQQQSAIWELVETEATYISSLKVITDLFLACLCNLQNEKLLNEIDTEKLFSNIQDIYLCNLTFWKDHICVMLNEARRTRMPLDPFYMAEGFFKFEEHFRPYTLYCLEQTNCQMYCKENSRENNHFRAYLAWCETQKECNRLKLVDILVHPMQRLTRYSILLKAILKKTEAERQRESLQEMICHVDRFVTTVNTALRNKHEEERLSDIIKKIETYEAVEARDDDLAATIKQHSELNLLQKMPECPDHLPRWFLFRADFKLRDSQTAKSDIHVFLFTDLLLITKITQRKNDKVKIVRPPYRIDRLIPVDLKDPSTLGIIVLNDWGVAATAFTLQSSDQKGHKALRDALATARKQYEEAKHSRHVPIYEMDDISSQIPRSPRLSSRGSRVSSLAPSHSGSMDLNETSYQSPGGHHPPSVDLSEIRASSASSEDSSFSGPQGEIHRSKSLEGQHPGSSPRSDRRIGFPKTPNTLSVIPPYATGQSMPNLTSESPNSLRVPTHKPLSPASRGISYPPPSPRTLRRCPPVPQSRNPPLLKTKNVTSVIGSPLEAQVVESDQRNDHESDDQKMRRPSRGERLDNRRYHTAGAIDDIKRQDTKDTSIHKRLSWNYGQGPPTAAQPRESEEPSHLLCRHQKGNCKSISSESVHSSSGVSSTSSLHRSEFENDIIELDGTDPTVVALSISDCTSLKLSPHISTTYICRDSDITLGVSTSQYITQPVEDIQGGGESCCEKSQTGVKIDVSEGDPTSATHSSSSSVQITVNDGASSKKTFPAPAPPSSSSLSSSSFSSSSSSCSSGSSSSMSSSCCSQPQKPPKEDKMREILLNDASIETSDV